MYIPIFFILSCLISSTVYFFSSSNSTQRTPFRVIVCSGSYFTYYIYIYIIHVILNVVSFLAPKKWYSTANSRALSCYIHYFYVNNGSHGHLYVKSVTYSDDVTECSLNSAVPLISMELNMVFSSLCWFTDLQLHCFGFTLTALIAPQQTAVFSPKKL